MVCVFVFVCLWGSTFAGLAFCATLSMTKLIIIIIIIKFIALACRGGELSDELPLFELLLLLLLCRGGEHI